MFGAITLLLWLGVGSCSVLLFQLVDGMVITDMRTAAASACAIRVSGPYQFQRKEQTSVSFSPSPTLSSFSPPLPLSLSPSPSCIQALVPKPPSILCIVGSGVQARSHAEALRVHQSFSQVERTKLLLQEIHE